MSLRQPGVYISDAVMGPAASGTETAVPVFIGYAQQGEPGTLYAIASFPDYTDLLGGADPRSLLFHAVRHYFESGGAPCFVLVAEVYEDIPDSADGIAAQLSAPTLLGKVLQEPAITLMCMPDMVLLADDQPWLWGAVWSAMLGTCRRGLNLFALLDTPARAGAAKACLDHVEDSDGIERGAAYWPRLVVDASGGRPALPPSAAIAAAIQLTDYTRGVWKAPANVALAGVIKPEYDHLEGSVLFQENGASINLVRSFPGRGVRVWGARTLVRDPASAWRYVQVRRLVSYIEANLRDRAQFMVFEPNTALTWIKFKGLATLWLRNLWSSGGLMGVQEAEAFQLRIGLNETMTGQDIMQGRLIVQVALAVQAPAEFIHARIELNIDGRPAEQSNPPLSNRSLLT